MILPIYYLNYLIENCLKNLNFKNLKKSKNIRNFCSKVLRLN